VKVVEREGKKKDSGQMWGNEKSEEQAGTSSRKRHVWIWLNSRQWEERKREDLACPTHYILDD